MQNVTWGRFSRGTQVLPAFFPESSSLRGGERMRPWRQSSLEVMRVLKEEMWVGEEEEDKRRR